MNLNKFVITLLLSPLILASFSPSKYPNTAVLSPYYTIFWSINENTFHLAIQAQTTGWVGFGLGEPTSGSMPGADILVGFVESSSGKTTISDRFSLDYVEPAIDICQDWKLISGTESAGT